MSGSINGGGGIPFPGREVEYAIELWLDGPSAFWLHPKGPLSDQTPDEWRVEQRGQFDACAVPWNMPLGHPAQQAVSNPYLRQSLIRSVRR